METTEIKSKPFLKRVIGNQKFIKKVWILLKFGYRTKSKRWDFVRHTFSCHSFVKQADDGIDLYCSWPYLSTYLGHKSLEATEKYVRLTAQLYPELMKNADRMYVDILPSLDLNINNDHNKNKL